MVFRLILRYLLNSETVIQKLSESYPIKRAARFTVYLFSRREELGITPIKSLKDSFGSFRHTFKSELQKGIEEFKKKQ